MKLKFAGLSRLAITACSFFAFQLANVQAADVVTVNVATAYAADNFQTQNLQQYANEVSKITNGQINLKIHSAGALIKPAEIFSGVRDAKAEAGEVIMSSLAKEIPLCAIDALPFIVSGYGDARRMWEVSRAGIEKALSERGLKLLYAVPWPPQHLYANRPINTIQDFKGLRMRIYNPATERIAQLIGAKPVTIQAIDLPKAIAEEKFDLMLTSSSTGVETKAWSKLQHYYKVNAWIPKNMVFINKKVFDRLDTELQKKLFDSAKAAEQRGWKMSQETDLEYESQLIANKVSVAVIDPFIRRYLDRMGENLAREWLKQAGGEELSVLLKYTTERSMK